MEIAFDAILIKFFETFGGKMPIWLATLILVFVFLLSTKNKILGKFFSSLTFIFTRNHKIQEKIARHLTKTSSTLEKFSSNVNQNTQMLKDNIDKGFAEVLLKINDLPSKEFHTSQTEEVKKKISDLQSSITDFIKIVTKKQT